VSASPDREEFLVAIVNNLPADIAPDRRSALVAAEAERASELSAQGTIVRLWRVAGRRQNVGIWAAPSADALHRALESLPMFPYLEITVTPLAKHPSDPGR
jgi:muconolactone D-isomerase